MNYCPQCGFKIDSRFNFCSNCGSRIEVSDPNQSLKQPKDYIVCKNCGEENPKENLECFSCGASLNTNKLKSQNKSGSNSKKNNKKGSSSVDSRTKNREINSEKILDNKKMILISLSIITIFIIALFVSGIFDSGIETNVSQSEQQLKNSTSGSVNLANVEDINQLEEKIKANPDDLESTLHLAHLQQDAGLSDKAISNYKKYLVKFPENADARVDMAICYYNLNDYNSAISEMETAIKYQPDHQIAYLNLGIVNLSAKNLEVSKKWFTKTIELDPNSEAGKRAQELLNSHL